MSTAVGVRATVIVGPVLLCGSSLDFGFGENISALIAARAIQGVACGLVWGGGLGWIAIEPPNRSEVARLASRSAPERSEL